MPVAGNQITQPWLYLAADSATGKTGMVTPADIVFTLKRESGGASIAATESITWTEKGSGFYDIIFTPQNSGPYSLWLHELNVDSMGRWFPFSWDIGAVGSVYLPSFANAFCSKSDVERWLQKAITSSTNPSDTETAGFAQSKATILQSLCASLGYPTTPATVTAGSRIENLLREANAVGAALDYELAQQLRVSPNRSERIDYFLGIWQQYYGQGPFEGTPGAKPAGKGYIEVEIRGNLASLATNHILSGDTVAPSGGSAPTDAGIQISMGSVF